MSQKAMTIRLSTEQAELLETVANVSNQPVSEVIRAAIDSHIQSVAHDEAFQQGLRERIERAQTLLRSSVDGKSRRGGTRASSN